CPRTITELETSDPQLKSRCALQLLPDLLRDLSGINVASAVVCFPVF
ncbi:hypothetical protein CTA1_2652, partial [Colletotrichum tanaceti]